MAQYGLAFRRKKSGRHNEGGVSSKKGGVSSQERWPCRFSVHTVLRVITAWSRAMVLVTDYVMEVVAIADNYA